MCVLSGNILQLAVPTASYFLSNRENSTKPRVSVNFNRDVRALGRGRTMEEDHKYMATNDLLIKTGGYMVGFNMQIFTAAAQ